MDLCGAFLELAPQPIGWSPLRGCMSTLMPDGSLPTPVRSSSVSVS